MNDDVARHGVRGGEDDGGRGGGDHPRHGQSVPNLGYPAAEERQTRLRLAQVIDGPIGCRRLTQATAAARMGITQPKASALASYRLEGFSVERLMLLLTALDQGVEIVVRSKPESRAAGRITVDEA